MRADSIETKIFESVNQLVAFDWQSVREVAEFREQIEDAHRCRPIEGVEKSYLCAGIVGDEQSIWSGRKRRRAAKFATA